MSYFDIYDYQTEERKVLPLEVDPDQDITFHGAAGFVRPQTQADDEDEDEDLVSPDDESISVKLTAIQEVWTDKKSVHQHLLYLLIWLRWINSEIWIRTQFAWYILEFPSHRYRKYYEKMKSAARNYKPPKSFVSRPSRRQEDALAPFITPRVGKIAQGLFLRSLIMSNERGVSDSELENVCVADIPFVRHIANPTTVEWGEEIPGAKGFYKSVFVDGVEYHVRSTLCRVRILTNPILSIQVNDTVAVAAPEASSSEDDNTENLSNKAW